MSRISNSSLHLFAKVFKRGFELVAQLSLGLFGGEVVAVVHVLMLAQVGRDFADFRVELDLGVFLLAHHDGVFKVEMQEDDHLAIARLEKSVLHVVVQNVHFVAADLRMESEK